MTDDADDPFGARSMEMPLGIVVEKRPSTSRWISHVWVPVAVMPGAPPVDDWRLLAEEDGVERYQIATLTLELHRKETEAYLANLANDRPAVYVVLREPDPDDECPHEIMAFCATASPYEAQDFLDSGEDLVEPVPMTDGLIAWVREFTDRHHVETVFKKRKRKEHREDEAQFGKRLDPIEQRYYDKRKLH